MAIPFINFGGLGSGLDTNGIIRQIIEVERVPLFQLQNRRASYLAKDQAWQTIATRLDALTVAADDVATLSAWNARVKATSSDSAVAGATVSGEAAVGSLSFTVDALATSHQLASGSSFGSGSDLVGAGTFTVTVGGVAHDVVATSSTTLDQLATQVNSLGIGVLATVVSIDGASAKLVLSAGATGASSAFTASGTQASLTTFSTLQQGRDSQVTIGSGAGALTVTRASNTISDLMAGVTVDLKATSTVAVTVSVGRDIDGAVAAVRGLVNELNTVIGTLSELTAYDPESGAAGVLQGDSTVRSLMVGIRSQVSSAVSGLTGSYTHAASAGLKLTRDGTFALDETKLRQALADDFQAVSRLFSRVGSTTDARLRYVTSTSSTVDGAYSVVVTQAATRASVTGTAYVAPVSSETFSITSGSRVATVVIDSTDTVTSAVTKVNDALKTAGITTVTASAVTVGAGQGLQLDESRYGSAAAFTVGANSFGLAGTFSGVDVAGTIGGAAATGSGRYLTATTGASSDLMVEAAVTQAEVTAAGGNLSLGTVEVVTGFAQRLTDHLTAATKADGAIARARDRWDRQIRYTDDRIVHLQARLERREAALIAQFAAMESAMSRLSGVASSIGSQLSQWSSQG